MGRIAGIQLPLKALVSGLLTSSHMVRMDPTSGPSACILGLSHRDSQDGSLGIDALLARDRLAREGVFIWIGCNGGEGVGL